LCRDVQQEYSRAAGDVHTQSTFFLAGDFHAVSLRPVAPERTHGPGSANNGSFSFVYLLFFEFLDFVDFGAIYRVAEDGARERAEGGIRICRERHYHLVVSLVSFEMLQASAWRSGSSFFFFLSLSGDLI
jgi:hypothetical protein